MPAPFEAPALPSRPRSPPPTRFTPRTPSAAPAQPSPSPSTRCSELFANSQAHPADGLRSEIRIERRDSNLLGGLVLAETLQAIAQAPLQRRGRVGIECYEIPQRLAAILAQPGERRRIGVRMPCHIFANRTIRMFRQLV